MKHVGTLILLMLLSSFSSKSQNCCDSLNIAKSFGRVLVKDIALKDSLLNIRKQTIQLLQIEAKSLSQENYKLLNSNLLMSKKIKKVRIRKNIALGFSFGAFVLLLL